MSKISKLLGSLTEVHVAISRETLEFFGLKRPDIVKFEKENGYAYQIELSSPVLITKLGLALMKNLPKNSIQRTFGNIKKSYLRIVFKNDFELRLNVTPPTLEASMYGAVIDLDQSIDRINEASDRQWFEVVKELSKVLKSDYDEVDTDYYVLYDSSIKRKEVDNAMRKIKTPRVGAISIQLGTDSDIFVHINAK